MLVKDKFGNMHSVPDRYDNKEIIVPSTQTKTFRGLKPINILSRSGYNWNKSSTRVNEARAVTLKINGPTNNQDISGKIGSRKKTNW